MRPRTSAAPAFACASRGSSLGSFVEPSRAGEVNIVAQMVPIVASGRDRSRNTPWALPGLLLLLSVIAGLMLMHGVQASAAPTDIRGIPLVSSSSDAHQSMAHKGHSCGHGCDDNQHPGGQMCLALLVLGALFLVASLLIRRQRKRTTTRRPATPRHMHPGRPPPIPSIFQLSVLRL
jgi:hypothetical protein